jgi:hypothetical protein
MTAEKWRSTKKKVKDESVSGKPRKSCVGR